MSSPSAQPQPTVSAPTVEQHPTGFGVGTSSPRLSWRFIVSESCSTAKDWQQSGYELEVVRSASKSTGTASTESYKISRSDSVLVPWPSTPLRSREQARVRIRAYGNWGSEPTEWSPWTFVECALLEREDWSAHPITSAEQFPSDIPEGPLRPLRFRKTFSVPHEAVSAIQERSRLYITSLGVYRAFVNGNQVGDEIMAPGWTSYKHRLNFQVFDIAHFLKPGQANFIAVEVAEGWWATRLGFHGGKRQIYGAEIGVVAQLEIGAQHDVNRFRLVSDATWVCHPSAIIRSEIYDGEVYDAREETPGWTEQPEQEQAQTWHPVRLLPFPQAELVSPNAPPVRVTEEIKPAEIITTPAGKTVVDFGQNLVGRLLIRDLRKPKGHKVIFTHAEVLENGELGTRPLRVAKCADTLISAGELLESWSPQYTFHGFRYVQVDGWWPQDDDAKKPSLKDISSSLSAQVIHTDMTRTGHFSCSHAMINKLHQNALWSMRGNFLSIPTDCPQRDERLGWTGDIQIFCPSANFLYNTAGMLGDWLKDLAAEHLEEGANSIPPFVVPNVLQGLWPQEPQAVWDDVTVLTPWALYRSYGDIEILRRQYPSMIAWVDKGIRRGPDRLWDPELWQLGDWLDPTAPPDEPGNARTNGTLVADAYLVHVTYVLAEVSKILCANDNAVRYSIDFQKLKATFQHKYIAPSGYLVGDSQTGLSLALVYDLHATPEQASRAADRLVQLVRFARFRVATGFVGTPIITHALTKGGHHQVAYRMLQEKNLPSWMYPISMGATTVWERWDSMLPDGSINPGEMTSFNHYALGSVVNWLHESVAGISPIEPGWKTFKVAPIPGGTVTSAEASYEIPYGRLECRWSICDDDKFELNLLIPVNTRALVVLPHERSEAKKESVGKWIGSGQHRFQSRWSNLSKWPPKPLVPPVGDWDQDTFV